MEKEIALRKCLERYFSKNTIDEFFKFMQIKKQLNDYNSTKCSPSEKIDKCWHKAILFTKEYREFCGDTFIEHNPNGMYDSKRNDRYIRTLKWYKKLFEIDPPIRYWESADTIDAIIKPKIKKVKRIYVNINYNDKSRRNYRRILLCMWTWSR